MFAPLYKYCLLFRLIQIVFLCFWHAFTMILLPNWFIILINLFVAAPATGIYYHTVFWRRHFLTNLLERIEWRFCFHNKICPFDLKRRHGRALYSSCFINVAGFFLHKILYTCFRKVKCRIKKHKSFKFCVLIDTIVLR